MPLDSRPEKYPKDNQRKNYSRLPKARTRGTLKRKPNELSGGQRQRVALGRLLVRNPSIHLLDEPLEQLGCKFTHIHAACQLAELHKEYQKTTLFVTHDQVEAMTLGQRLCVMNQGNIIQVGTPTEIYDFPEPSLCGGIFWIPSNQSV